MNASIGEKKTFGGVAPRYKRLEGYRRCRGVTCGIRAWFELMLKQGLLVKGLKP